MVLAEQFISDIVECRISQVALRPDGILLISIKPEELFSVSDYNDLTNAAKRIGKGEKFLNLIIVGAHTIPDHDSRVLSTSKQGSKYKLADAFVISSLSQKLIANFYMNFHKPYVPSRFFNDEKKAVEWLLSFKRE